MRILSNFKILFLTFFFLISGETQHTLAMRDEKQDESALVSEYLSLLDMDSVEQILKSGGYGEKPPSFRQITEQAIRGELDISPANIMKNVAQIFLNELYLNGALMRSLLVVSILSALLKNLTESFKSKEVGEVGFYVSYVVLVAILMTSFNVTANLVQDLINTLSGLMKASIPLMLSLLVMSGSVAGAYAFNPILFFIIEISVSVIGGVILPIILLAAGVQIANYLTEKEMLGKLSELIKKSCEWGLKGIMFLFMSALSLQRISAPILNNVALKTARSAAGAVPVVGDMLTGAMDSVITFASAAKSGVAVAIVILIAMACAAPLIKLFTLIIVYKLTAAIIEPVCDDRIVDCIDAIGEFSFLILASAAAVVALFVFAVMILLSF